MQDLKRKIKNAILKLPENEFSEIIEDLESVLIFFDEETKAKKKYLNKKENEIGYLDIASAIKEFNKNAPAGGKVSRKSIADKINVTYQTMTNYQMGRLPRAFTDVKELEVILKTSFSKLYKLKQKNESI